MLKLIVNTTTKLRDKSGLRCTICNALELSNDTTIEINVFDMPYVFKRLCHYGRHILFYNQDEQPLSFTVAYRPMTEINYSKICELIIGETNPITSVTFNADPIILSSVGEDLEENTISLVFGLLTNIHIQDKKGYVQKDEETTSSKSGPILKRYLDI